MTIEERLDDYLEESGLEAVWFARSNGFAWLTGGGDNVVTGDSRVGVAAVGYDGEQRRLVTDNIEVDRILAEEVDGDVAVDTFAWHESNLAEAAAEVSPTPAAADFDVPGFERVDGSDLRQPLTERQVASYRELSADVARAVESVAREADADDTERGTAAELRRALARRDAAAPVVLVGGGERAQSYRHYTPKDDPLGEYALLSVTAARDGLYASCTRTVAFDAPDWLDAWTRDAMRVEVTALAATREVGERGGTAGEVFDAIREAYASLGWEGEWENHHQGGAAGFDGREWIGTPDGEERVWLPMGYAWNPTIQGAKSEDTHLVTEDGVEPMSVTGEWPTETVAAVDYDLELARPMPLDA